MVPWWVRTPAGVKLGRSAASLPSPVSMTLHESSGAVVWLAVQALAMRGSEAKDFLQQAIRTGRRGAQAKRRVPVGSGGRQERAGRRRCNGKTDRRGDCGGAAAPGVPGWLLGEVGGASWSRQLKRPLCCKRKQPLGAARIGPATRGGRGSGFWCDHSKLLLLSLKISYPPERTTASALLLAVRPI
ncbi:hypothetical protein BDY21DRAFT_342893 [Lineolata rhizophorae]|uniref:Uncharacterized protein n=1 Tax=Lineolata rhizophorae TaxID=578093 RepID=A0A6A6P1E4_9PEZI|nr:hypothetical protein BDY21DRAFT_342893 [Lineolata rhizophorae]